MWDLIVSVPDHCLSFYFSGGHRSSKMLGKEMGHEIPTSQMQYNAEYNTEYKETDK